MELTERDALTLWRSALTECVRSDAPDLTARQQAILMTVALTPGPHTVRGLASHLEIAKPAVTRAIDTLTRYGLVRRVKDDSDLRSVHIERTVDGANHLRTLAALILSASEGHSADDTRIVKDRKAA